MRTARRANFREARNQAYEIYLLARNGTVVTNALEHNHNWLEANAKGKWNDDIVAAYEAATYALLKNQDQADALIKGFDLQNGKHRWPQEEVDYDDDLGRAAQYIYLLAHDFPGAAEDADTRRSADAGLSDHQRRLQHHLLGGGDPGAGCVWPRDEGELPRRAAWRSTR